MEIDELHEKLFKKQEELDKSVYVSEHNVVINVTYEYNIELNRCDSLQKIVAWNLHLYEKTWMTLEIMERFVYVAAKANNLKLPHV